jgi:acetyltransferase-like isoleucine patch superfamily enzyme
MANTISILSYANTFGDWIVTTNALTKENNDLAANNYIKPTGTLYLNSPTLGLQVANVAIIQGQLQVQGTGSSAYIQNNLRVDQQVYFTNTSLSLVASGQANVGGLLLAKGSGTGLNVSNNVIIGGNTTIAGFTSITGNASIGLDTSIGGNTIISGFTSIGSNTSIGGNTTIGGNTSIGGNTTIGGKLTVTDYVTSNKQLISPSINIANTLFANTADGRIKNLYIDGQLSVNGDFVLTGTTVYDTNKFTINSGSAIGLTSYFEVNRGSSGANAEIRWNESGKYWDLLDVDSSTYYQVTTSKTPSTTSYNGTIGQAVSSNGVVSFSSNNGMVISGTSNTITISTPQNLRTSASPTFVGLTLSGTPLAITGGGTGASSSSSALTNLLPTGTTSGYVLTTGGPGSFYWAAGGGGGGGATPGTTIQSTRLSYIADGSSTLYTAPEYIPGNSQLRIYIDGVRQFASAYTETSNTSVTLGTSAPSGSNILLEVDGYIKNPYYANNIAFTVNSNISGTANTIQLAIDGLTSKLVTNYALNSYVLSAYNQANTATTQLIPISQGGSGATSSTQALNNLLPTGQVSGYVLTTGGTGSYYWAAGGGGGGATPGTTINTTRIYPQVNASQTIFTTPTYTPGTGQLRVYVNGVRQFGSEYTETSNTVVTLGTGATSGDVILLEVDGYINNPYYANTIAFSVNGNISSTANTIQLAIDGLTSKLTTYYANTQYGTTFANTVTFSANTAFSSNVSFTGISTSLTPANTTSNTQIATTQFVNNLLNVNVGSTSNVQHFSLGVGTAASSVKGEIRAIDNITAYYSSDITLKENVNDISNAVDIVYQIGGKTFDWTDEYIQEHGGEDGYFVQKSDFGVIAQDVEKVFPLAVRKRQDGLLAVDYEKLCALAFAAIKELKDEIEILKGNSK